MSENLLVAAKSEYTEQLNEILCENIYNGIKTIWNSCKDTEKVNTLKCFQRKLCDIPNWNQEIINKIFKTIINAVDVSENYIDKIIEAVFLSNVKILSVVKSSNKSKKINVSIPDTKNFIHRCYIESARAFYCDPFLIDDRETGVNGQIEIQRNVRRSMNVIKISIEKTIRAMMPMEDILKKYLENQEDEYQKEYSEPESQEGPEPEPVEQEVHEAEQGPDLDVDDVFNAKPSEEVSQPVHDPFGERPEQEPEYGSHLDEPRPEPSQPVYGPFNEQRPYQEDRYPVQQQAPQSQPAPSLVVNLKNGGDDDKNFFD